MANAALLMLNEPPIRRLIGPVVAAVGIETLKALLPVWLGLALAILVCSLLLCLKPHQHICWGVIIMTSGVASFLIGGGFVFGGVFSVISGFTAVLRHPPRANATMPGTQDTGRKGPPFATQDEERRCGETSPSKRNDEET